jgi:hypothetical protein
MGYTILYSIAKGVWGCLFCLLSIAMACLPRLLNTCLTLCRTYEQMLCCTFTIINKVIGTCDSLEEQGHDNRIDKERQEYRVYSAR